MILRIISRDRRTDRMPKPKIALVLGAGSARGLAHIGVLQVLKEQDISFDFIVGSSMGAMVGGIFSSGADIYLLDRMVEYMNHSILYDVNLPRQGFMAGRRISGFLELLTKHKDFQQLDPPLCVVATDLVTGERVVVEEGSVAEAIRASISIPGIFRPVRKEDRILVDGAVTDRLPVDVARECGADLIVAVDVTFCEGKRVVIRNTWDVIMTALDIMQKQQFEAAAPQADILIQPAVGGFSPRDFDRSREIVDLGRQAALDKIATIQETIRAWQPG